MKREMKRPVMTGVALTNRPHIRLRNYPIEVIEENDKPMFRVPFMVAGRYLHPSGELDFTEQVFDDFIKNQTAKIADNDLGLDAKHQPDRGAWAWFEPALGGRVVKEVINGDKLLVGYGVPTDEDAVDKLKKSVFRYASLEFHPNYRSNLKQTYLSEDLEEWQEPEKEVITLFNPFHSSSDGRFTSKKGGGSSGVSKGIASRKNSVAYGVKEGVSAMFSRNGFNNPKFKMNRKASAQKQRVAGRVLGYIATGGVIAFGTIAIAEAVLG
jgi:hypothetical protein